jgi:DNA repair exonuclease SbcCD ATPase subunit
MTDQVTDTPTLIPCAPKEKSTGSEADVMDQAANAILGLVDRAADTAVADVQEAREFAEKLADELRAARDQLRVAQDRINNLEAKVGYYQDRTDRAEKWLRQISSKIEQRFFDATGRPLFQQQIKMTGGNVAPPVEELLEETETQRIAAKFAPEEHRGTRRLFSLRKSSDS